jgi:hypothetical protein
MPESTKKQREVVVLYKGPLKGAGRSVDVKFWQALGSRQIFASAWEMVEFAWTFKGRDVTELQFQRTAEHVQRRGR